LFPVWLCLAAILAAASSVSAATLTVNAGGDLQAAIDAAHPGDTIVLQAGATFNGPFRLRVKNGSTPITIRSSSADGVLPRRCSPRFDRRRRGRR
jgi:nitrous oxidase accessory protein NosD